MSNHCLIFNVSKYAHHGRNSGGHRIASHLRSQQWDAEVIDFSAFWSFEELQLLAKSRITKNTKFLGFSFIFSSAWSDHLEKFCHWIKQTYPGLILIFGAQQPSGINTDVFDYYILGYSEHALDAVLKYQFSNGTRPKFKLSRHNAGLVLDANLYPSYPLSEPNIIYETRDFIVPGEWVSIEFSRGCKFACKFCNYPIIGVKGDYTRTAESARRQMMDAYDRFGVTNYIVTDDTFNDRTEKITKFADMVETLPWQPYMVGFVRADLLISRPKDKEELARMGMFGQTYGIESFNSESVKVVGKGMPAEKIQAGLIDIENYYMKMNRGYRATIALILGLPHETIESFNKTIEWLDQHWLRQSIALWPLSIQNPEFSKPSEIALDYKKYGYRELPKDINLDDADSRNGVSDKESINWINDHMSYQQACDYVRKIKTTKPAIFANRQMFEIAFMLLHDDLTPWTLEQRLQAKQDDNEYNNITSRANRFIKRYIEQKLNL